MEQKFVIFYHANCTDGFGSAVLLKKALIEIQNINRESIALIPSSYGDTELPDVTGAIVFIVDFSFSPAQTVDLILRSKATIHLDHHATAIKKLDNLTSHQPSPDLRAEIDLKYIPLLVSDIFSGIGLVHVFIEKCFGLEATTRDIRWGYNLFSPEGLADMAEVVKALKQEITNPDLIATEVSDDGCQSMPYIARLIQDRDLWQFKYPETKAITNLLYAMPFVEEAWSDLFEIMDPREGAFLDLYKIAEPLYQKKQLDIQFAMEHGARILSELRVGDDVYYEVAVANIQSAIVSEGLAKLVDTGLCNFAIAWQVSAKNLILSFRSDGSENVRGIAESLGGGGHNAASGARLPLTDPRSMALLLAFTQDGEPFYDDEEED